MSQASSYTVENNPGAQVRADINTIIAALVSNGMGAAEPSETHAGMLWADTTADRLKIRNEANTAWLTLPVSITASLAMPDGLDALDDVSMRRLVALGTAGAEWTLDPRPDDSGDELLIAPDAVPSFFNATVRLKRGGDISIPYGNIITAGNVQPLGGVQFHDGTTALSAGVEHSWALHLPVPATITATSWATITNMETTYTPKSTDNWLFISATVNAAADGAGGFLRVEVDGTPPMEAFAAGSRTLAHAKVTASSMAPHAINVVDTSPPAGPFTIRVRGQAASGSTLYINRGTKDYDEAQYARGPSVLTIMEVAK